MSWKKNPWDEKNQNLHFFKNNFKKFHYKSAGTNRVVLSAEFTGICGWKLQNKT